MLKIVTDHYGTRRERYTLVYMDTPTNNLTLMVIWDPSVSWLKKAQCTVSYWGLLFANVFQFINKWLFTETLDFHMTEAVPQDAIKQALMYEGRPVWVCARGTLPTTMAGSFPGRARSWRCTALWHHWASSCPPHGSVACWCCTSAIAEKGSEKITRSRTLRSKGEKRAQTVWVHHNSWFMSQCLVFD